MSGAGALDVSSAFVPYGRMATKAPLDLPYSVEQWDDADLHVEELIALTGDFRVAKAAFDQAVKTRPGRIITLRQKARLLDDSRRERRS